MNRTITMFVFAVVGLASGSAAAHDYWLEPARFAVARGERVDVSLVVGDSLVIEQRREYQPEKTERFELVAADRTVDLRMRATAGAEPVVEGLPLDFDGAGLIAMERGWTDIVLTDEKFTHYLEHEGLTEIAKLREANGHREQERERYRRSVKTLVRSGEAKRSRVARRVLGHRMEIVLLDDPFRRDAGDALRARVVLEGKPLRDAVVTAHVRDAAGKVKTQRVRTNRRGIARVQLASAGTWVVRLVHMQACRGCADADWESFWASFTFAVD